MKQLKILLFVFLSSCIIFSTANGKIINCYWGTWANYRSGDGKFQASNIDPTLCTHLSYSFFGISDSGEIKHLDPYLDKDLGLMKQAIELKQKNKDLKVLAVVGGWNEGSQKYSQMAADPQKRRLFIESALRLIKANGFDGLDLDWEYPSKREGSSPQDKQNFVILLKEIYAAFKRENLIFSIAVGASAETAATSYDIPQIAQNVDFINVMTYDFASAAEGVVGYNAPLKGQGERNVVSSINYWLKQGAPASKLVLGLGFYGQTFTLANSEQYSLGSQTTGAGEAGPFTQQRGFMGYNEICIKELDKNAWSYKWMEQNSVPTLRSSNQFISYDDAKSIGKKVDFAMASKLGGVMIWSIETDDFHGNCKQGKFPLLRAINKKLGKNKVSNDRGIDRVTFSDSMYTNKKKNVSPTKSIPSKPYQPVNTNGGCINNGFYGDTSNLNIFYRCERGVQYKFYCPPSMHFDPSINNCNYSYNS